MWMEYRNGLDNILSALLPLWNHSFPTHEVPMGLSIIKHIPILHIQAKPQRWMHDTGLTMDRTTFFLNRTIAPMTKARSITRAFLWIIYLDSGGKTGNTRHESTTDPYAPDTLRESLWRTECEGHIQGKAVAIEIHILENCLNSGY